MCGSDAIFLNEFPVFTLTVTSETGTLTEYVVQIFLELLGQKNLRGILSLFGHCCRSTLKTSTRNDLTGARQKEIGRPETC